MMNSADWAAHKSVGTFTWLWFAFRSIIIMFVVDNPLSWKMGLRGDSNKFDDVEGPYFIQGAPMRQVGDGKAVLAPNDLLEKFDPMLIILELRDTKGRPVPHAMIDSWQADGAGEYYLLSYTLRGKAVTDANGRLELLTIRPKGYVGRAAHNHLRIYSSSNALRQMTTQLYICENDDAADLNTDVSNMWRPRPDSQMLKCWALEKGQNGEKYHGHVLLPKDDADTADAVARWNATLAEAGVHKRLMSVGRLEIPITAY